MESSPITITDLASVVYSAGKVFDGLRTGRLSTAEFLRSGNTQGISSRADLALLEDLRDVASFVVDHARPQVVVDGRFVRSLNEQITRSGALHPGRLRTAQQQIGVSTPHGRHEPNAVTEPMLEEILSRAQHGPDASASAITLFIDVAKAQPFEDGNKRTALFAANALLLSKETGLLLTVPVDDASPDLSNSFVDALARAYIFDDYSPATRLLEAHGLKSIDEQRERYAKHASEAEQTGSQHGVGAPDSNPRDSEHEQNAPNVQATSPIGTWPLQPEALRSWPSATPSTPHGGPESPMLPSL